MRTLAITQNITLDGSIEMLDDWFDPQARGLGNMEGVSGRDPAAERRRARPADGRRSKTSGSTGRTWRTTRPGRAST